MKLMYVTTRTGNLFVFKLLEGTKSLIPFSYGYYCKSDGTPLRKVESAAKELEWAMKKWEVCVEEQVTGDLKEKVSPLFNTAPTFTFVEPESKRRKRDRHDNFLPQGKRIPNKPFAGLANMLTEKKEK